MNTVQLGGKVARGGGNTVPATAYFDGDGVTQEFIIDDDNDISIHSVFVGGQRFKEGVDYSKDNETKTITILGDPVPVGVGIDVEYFSDVSVRGAVSINHLSAAQLAQLANDIAPYLL